MTISVTRRDVHCGATIRRAVDDPEEFCGFEGVVDLELHGRDDDPSWLWQCPECGYQHCGDSLDQLP